MSITMPRKEMSRLAPWFALLVAFGLVPLFQKPAYGFCYKPTPPYKPYSFSTNDQIDSYNRKVDLYNYQLATYRECFSRSYDSYEQRFKDCLRCEAGSFGKQYSGCIRPSPPQ